MMPDPSKITFKMRDSADALYPCSIVDTMYQFSCYQLQGGLILNRVHSDFAQGDRRMRQGAADRAVAVLR